MPVKFPERQTRHDVVGLFVVGLFVLVLFVVFVLLCCRLFQFGTRLSCFVTENVSPNIFDKRPCHQTHLIFVFCYFGVSPVLFCAKACHEFCCVANCKFTTTRFELQVHKKKYDVVKPCVKLCVCFFIFIAPTCSSFRIPDMTLFSVVLAAFAVAAALVADVIVLAADTASNVASDVESNMESNVMASNVESNVESNVAASNVVASDAASFFVTQIACNGTSNGTSSKVETKSKTKPNSETKIRKRGVDDSGALCLQVERSVNGTMEHSVNAPQDTCTAQQCLECATLCLQDFGDTFSCCVPESWSPGKFNCCCYAQWAPCDGVCGASGLC
jgi:hypothetical protein